MKFHFRISFDNEKLKIQNEELTRKLEESTTKATKYDEYVETVNMEIDAEKEGLDEDQLRVIEHIIDPSAKLSAIRQFKNITNPSPGVKKGGTPGEVTLDEIKELKDAGDPKWKVLWEKHKTKKGIQPTNPFKF